MKGQHRKGMKRRRKKVLQNTDLDLIEATRFTTAKAALTDLDLIGITASTDLEPIDATRFVASIVQYIVHTLFIHAIGPA